MARKKVIKLPSIITEKSWFYRDNEKILKPHLNKPYISYSTATSWQSYRNDMIKQKFVGLELPQGVYASLGNYLGSAVETGEFPQENPNGFTGQENLALINRPKGAEYERMVVLDMGSYVFLGFIDIFEEVKSEKKIKKVVCNVCDLKTGGSGKEKEYESEDYTQVVLYANALEKEGYEIGDTSVWFVRRTGSHVKPPLHISDEQFKIPLEYNKERVDFALKKLDKTVNEISDCYKTYLKFF